MTNLISKLRQACHDERRMNREVTELQLLALELCSEVEKRYLYKNENYDFLISAMNESDGTYKP
jgi:hypothetical protein